MKKTFKNRVLGNLISAIAFGAIYALLSFIDKGHVEINTLLITMLVYFIIMCLLYFIAPKLRKITGHDTDKS